MRPLPLLLTVGLAATLAATAALLPHAVNGSSTPTVPAAARPTWSPQQAATYLDNRELWWQQWPRAHKDHGTLCISCHTNLPYALVRPALQQQLHQTSAPAAETILLASVETRVSRWPEMVPFYSDAVSGPGKTAESHATEAVLNAIILTSYDANQPHLRPVTRTALDNAWALQLPSGGWQWQDFQLAPWEAPESSYQGAALLFLQLEAAPDHYATHPANRDHVDRLRNYLQTGYPTQPLINQLFVLWASSKSPTLLTNAQRQTLLQQLRSLQQDDGGWRLASIDTTPRQDDSQEPTTSDGMATALAVLAMEQTGTRPHDPTLQHGIQWLEHHQQPTGNWPATSLNKERDPSSNVGLFMSDAATSYAVLALQNAPHSPATH